MVLVSVSKLMFAQCSEFILYQAKGDVKVMQGSDSRLVQNNMKLTGDMHLLLANNTCVILLSGKDKALRLNVAGNYSMSEIKATCLKNQTSLTKEYLKYVAQSIIESGDPGTAMVIKGAVYRSRTEFEKTAMIEPADSSVVSSEQVTFTWRMGTAGVPKYLLIYENGVKQVYSGMLADTSVSINAELFKPGVIYFWLVSLNDIPSDKEPRFTFTYGETDWQSKFLEEWSATMEELNNDVDGLQQKIKSKKH